MWERLPVGEIFDEDFERETRTIIESEFQACSREWFDGSKAEARLLPVQFSIRGYTMVWVSLGAEFFFPGLEGVRRIRFHPDFSRLTRQPLETVRASMREQAACLAQAKVRKLFEGLPAGQKVYLPGTVNPKLFSEIRVSLAQWFQDRVGMEAGQFVRNAFDGLGPSFCQEICSGVNDILNGGAGQAPYPDLIPGHAVEVRLGVKTDGELRLHLHLEMDLDYLDYLDRWTLREDRALESFAPLSASLSPDSLKRELTERIRAHAWKTARELAEQLPRFQVSKPFAGGDPLRDTCLLLRGSPVQVGDLSFSVLPGPGDVKIRRVFQETLKGGIGVFYGANDTLELYRISANGILSGSLLRLGLRVGRPEKLSFLPLLEALRDGAQRYTRLEDAAGDRIPLEILVKPDASLSCTFLEHAWEWTAGAAPDPSSWAEDLRAWVLRTRSEVQAEEEENLARLGRLDEVELDMLRHLRETRHYRTRNEVFSPCAQRDWLTRQACQKRLQHLMDLSLSVQGRETPVMLIRGDGRTVSFRANRRIPADLLEKAVPRPWGPEDMKDLTPEGKRAWLETRTREVRNGTAEQRWELLRILESCMPKAVFTGFVKSTAGQEILSRFTGQDRAYARLVVEELPGCRRLAARLLSEEVPS